MVLDVHGKKEPSARDLFSLVVAKIIEKHTETCIFPQSSRPSFYSIIKSETHGI